MGEKEKNDSLNAKAKQVIRNPISFSIRKILKNSLTELFGYDLEYAVKDC
jgi:hypothetical protein